MYLLLLILTATLQTALGAPPSLIKEPFDQQKFMSGHTWWVHSFTEALYGDTDRCAHFKLKQTSDQVLLLFEFIDTKGEVQDSQLVITADKTHPAKFFVEAGDARVFELTVVEADYENWAICWAKIADKEAYHIVATKQDITAYESAIEATLTKLKLTMNDFLVVKNENCKDSLSN